MILILEHLQQQPVIHMDETTVQVLNEPDRKAQNKSYMWVMGVLTSAARFMINGHACHHD